MLAPNDAVIRDIVHIVPDIANARPAEIEVDLVAVAVAVTDHGMPLVIGGRRGPHGVENREAGADVRLDFRVPGGGGVKAARDDVPATVAEQLAQVGLGIQIGVDAGSVPLEIRFQSHAALVDEPGNRLPLRQRGGCGNAVRHVCPVIRGQAAEITEPVRTGTTADAVRVTVVAERCRRPLVEPEDLSQRAGAATCISPPAGAARRSGCVGVVGIILTPGGGQQHGVGHGRLLALVDGQWRDRRRCRRDLPRRMETCFRRGSALAQRVKIRQLTRKFGLDHRPETRGQILVGAGIGLQLDWRQLVIGAHQDETARRLGDHEADSARRRDNLATRSGTRCGGYGKLPGFSRACRNRIPHRVGDRNLPGLISINWRSPKPTGIWQGNYAKHTSQEKTEQSIPTFSEPGGHVSQLSIPLNPSPKHWRIIHPACHHYHAAKNGRNNEEYLYRLWLVEAV